MCQRKKIQPRYALLHQTTVALKAEKETAADTVFKKKTAA
jgi:hypothetical protein